MPSCQYEINSLHTNHSTYIPLDVIKRSIRIRKSSQSAAPSGHIHPGHRIHPKHRRNADKPPPRVLSGWQGLNGQPNLRVKGSLNRPLLLVVEVDVGHFGV